MLAVQEKNNFGAIRFILATNVLVAHFFIFNGNANTVTLGSLETGVDIGTISVGCFFGISGFLLTKSSTVQTTSKYLVNRVFRILPAYWFLLILTSSILYTINSSFLNAVSYNYEIPKINFVTYVASNFGLWQSQKEILGLFPNNFYPSLINGSLWSLFPEFLCYIALVAGIKSCLYFKLRLHIFLIVIMSISIIFGFSVHYLEQVQVCVTNLFPGKMIEVLRILNAIQSFALGCLLALLPRILDLIKKSKLTLVFLFLAFIFQTFSSLYFLLASTYLTVIVISLGSAEQKFKFFNWFDKHDLSYGIYLYHVPILQVLISLNSFDQITVSPTSMLALLIVLTLSFATLSWLFIERPSKRIAIKINSKFT